MSTDSTVLTGWCRVAACSPVLDVCGIDYNIAEIQKSVVQALNRGSSIVVFPELSVTGYSVADLFRSATVLSAARDAVVTLAGWSRTVNGVFVVGFPCMHGGRLYNCAAVIGGGRVLGVVPKTYLATSGEYYEQRWFASGHTIAGSSVSLAGVPVPFGTDLLFSDTENSDVVFGVEICEDLWAVEPPGGRLARQGATLLLNLSASNQLAGKTNKRRAVVTEHSRRTLTGYIYASAGPWESTTDTVYSAHCIIAAGGDVVAETEPLSMASAILVADIDVERLLCLRRHSGTFYQHSGQPMHRMVYDGRPFTVPSALLQPPSQNPFLSEPVSQYCAEISAIQATGLAVRIKRAGAKKLVIGVSGGLDSTLALLVCVKAVQQLGLDTGAVLAITMPGPGTTHRTRTNADLLAQVLGITLRSIPIDTAVHQHFSDIGHDADIHDVVFENAQARERTQILMDVANQVNGIVVGTADLSEIALGWATFNADHMAMYHVNSGIPKSVIRTMVEWWAETGDPQLATVLRDILQTPVSPELLPATGTATATQHTEEILGPYAVHDFFLYHFVGLQRPVTNTYYLACIVFKGLYNAQQLHDWFMIFLRRFFANQFKRNCSPDGIKIGPVSLSPRTDWRMPSDTSAELWVSELSRCIVFLP